MTQPPIDRAALIAALAQHGMKPPPIPGDFAKLVPGNTGRMTPDQAVRFCEYLAEWLNRSPSLPVKTRLDRDGYTLTMTIDVSLPQLPAKGEA